MSLWMVRVGRFGEHEQKFVDDNRIYLTWGIEDDLSSYSSRKGIAEYLTTTHPDQSHAKIANHAGQIFTFLNEMKPCDLVGVPSKKKSVIHIGEITGKYSYDQKADPDYRHYRTVKWIAPDTPRSAFKQQLLYSFGAIQTICQIKRGDAEARVRAIAKGGPVPLLSSIEAITKEADTDDVVAVDLERAAKDAIAQLIIQRFKGHGLALLVEAILNAQGFLTYRSGEGADKGIDILAAPAPLGFGSPRICVQVKSQESPVDRPTLDQLIGAMQNVHADQGLLVSWGGFKSSVDREEAAQFFRVRLWDQDSLLEQIFAHYDQLNEDVRAELPLKRIWTVVTDELSEE